MSLVMSPSDGAGAPPTGPTHVRSTTSLTGAARIARTAVCDPLAGVATAAVGRRQPTAAAQATVHGLTPMQPERLPAREARATPQ